MNKRTIYIENDIPISCLESQLIKLQKYDLELVKNPEDTHFINLKTKCLYDLWRFNHLNRKNNSHELVLQYINKTLNNASNNIHVLRMKAEILRENGKFNYAVEVYSKIICMKSSSFQTNLLRIKGILNKNIKEIRTLNQHIDEVIFTPILASSGRLSESRKRMSRYLIEDCIDLLYCKVRDLVDKTIEYKNNNEFNMYKKQIKKLYKIEKDILPVIFSGIINVGGHEDGSFEAEIYYTYIDIYEEIFRVFNNRNDIVNHLIYLYFITEPTPSFAPKYCRANELLDVCINKNLNNIDYYIQKYYLLNLQLLERQAHGYYEEGLKVSPNCRELVLLKEHFYGR